MNGVERIQTQVRRWRLVLAAGALLALGACASGPRAVPHDPLEPLNRGIYGFNDAVDRAVLKPVATVYRDITPDPVRTGVNNFFENLRDIWSTINAVAQLRPREATENFMRVNVNTLFGLGGVLDVASEMGIPKTELDFGQTLGRWGIPAGPYLMLPLLGPSSARDALGLGVELGGDQVRMIDDKTVRYSLQGLRAVEKRANLLRASELLEDVSLDKYSFTRDVYLQRRQSQIQDLIDKGVGVGNGASDETDDTPDTETHN